MTRSIDNARAYETLARWSQSGRIPHAILIEGERGSGRRALATQIAGAILCEGEPRPCGVCRHCVKVEKGIHPDLDFYSSEGGARSFHVETVRKIRADTAIRPGEADARVFLLLDAQKMSPQAQNALLKTLEEPVRGVHFILTCENREQMLPTTLSRVTAIALESPSAERCAELLSELAPGHEPERYHMAAAQAGGKVGAALALLQSGEESASRRAGETLRDLLEGRELEALAALQATERDRDGFAACLGLMRIAAAELAVGRGGAPAPVSPARMIRVIAVMDEAAAALDGNANLPLLVTTLCAKIRGVVADG